MDWLTTSTDDSTSSAYSSEVMTDFLAGGERQPDNARPWPLMHPEELDDGLTQCASETHQLPLSESPESDESGFDREYWTEVAPVSSVDLGTLVAPAELFPVGGTAALAGAGGVVDRLLSHNVGIEPVLPTAAAMAVGSSAALYAPRAGMLGTAPPAPSRTPAPAPVPRTKACTRKKRPKRIPSGASAKCPYCAGAVIIDRAIAPELTDLSDEKKLGRFARYRPRVSARKDNRLAAWYVKYGYSGPPYCKSCSESFNSHLLRQNAQAARARCSRASPCNPCGLILENFSGEPDEIYKQFDTRKESRKKSKLARTAKESTSTSQVKCELVGDDMLATSLVGHEPPGKKARSVVKTVAAVAISLVAVVAMLSAHSSGTGAVSTDDSHVHIDDKPGWLCGADFSKLVTGTVEAQMEIHCQGVDSQTEILCGVDECHAQGLVPSEPRVCRCDGCVRLGRCVGWQLVGHAPADASHALEDLSTCAPDSMPATARNSEGAEGAAASDVEQFSWLVPSMMRCERCSIMCSEHVGCVRFECGDEHEGSAPNPTPLLRSAPDPYSPKSCTLYSAFAWPQPIIAAGQDNSDPDVDLPVPEGVIWTGANGDAFQYVLNPSYWNTEVTELERMEVLSDGREDLQYMWRFDSVEQQWRAVQSSLTQRPSPRSGAATWHDSTGSMFLFSGSGCGEYGVNPYGGDRYIPDAVPGTPLVVGCDGIAQFADMWRYDTASLTWQLLHAEPQATGTEGTTYVRRETGWPSAREQATVWAHEDTHERHFVAWMFGGVGKLLGATLLQSGIGVTSEFWQFNYSYSDKLGTVVDPGEPEQPTDGGQPGRRLDDGYWVLVTIDQMEAQASTRSAISATAVHECSRRQACPGPRAGAGGWKDPLGRGGGWLFGGSSCYPDSQGDPVFGRLYDLWEFNGAVQRPVWRSIEMPPLPTESGALIWNWPPAWHGPTGWTTSAGGGEIWIVGESGMQYDVYTAQSAADGASNETASAADTWQSRNNMWVFSIAESRWGVIYAPLPGHLQTLAQGGATVLDPVKPWPGVRHSAVTGDGMMFGGIGSSECDPYPGPNGQAAQSGAEIGLTGLWTWVDTLGTEAAAEQV